MTYDATITERHLIFDKAPGRGWFSAALVVVAFGLGYGLADAPSASSDIGAVSPASAVSGSGEDWHGNVRRSLPGER